MNIENTNKKISELEDKSWDMDSVISTVNSTTKDIKSVSYTHLTLPTKA